MKTKLLFILLLFISITVSVAQTLDQSFTGSGNGSLGVDETQIKGQSFTAGLTGALTEISFDISSENSCSNSISEFNLTVEILDGDGFSGSILATENINIPLPYPRSMFPVSFTSPANVVSGQLYTIRISASPNQVCNWIIPPIEYEPVSGSWIGTTGNAYSNGVAYENGSPFSTFDLFFTTTVDTTLGIDDNSLIENITIYPNPTSRHLNISGLNKSEKYEIFDVLGNKTNIGNISNNEMIDISHLSKGIYFLKVGNSSASKLIKR